MQVSNKEALYKMIMETSFAIVDINLYLDTHPLDENAIEYFNFYQKVYNECLDEYTSNYGPINVITSKVTDRWNWVNQPWPWEGGCN